MSNSRFSRRRLALVVLAACLPAGPFALSAHAQQPSQPSQPPPQQPAAPDAHSAEKQAAQRQARGFLQYLDHDRYADSYAYTGELLRSKASKEQFVQETQKIRAGLGLPQSRKLLDASYTTTLPNVPEGQYVVLQYTTDFPNKKGAVETVTTEYRNGYWRVAGYFLK